jgi:hypothetical protein
MRPESVQTSELKALSFCGRMSAAQVFWAVVFMGTAVGASSVMSAVQLPAAVRYTLPLLCVLAGIAYFRVLFRDFRRYTDELQRRINLEAAVGTCVGIYVAMVVYPVFHKAGLIGPLNYVHVLLLLIVMYAAGYAVAMRRYR